MFNWLVGSTGSPSSLAPRALYFWIVVSSVAWLARPLQVSPVWCGVLLLLGGVVLARNWRPAEAMVWLVLRLATAAWSLPFLTSAQFVAVTVDFIWLCHLANASRAASIEAGESSESTDESADGHDSPNTDCVDQLPWQGLPVRAVVAVAVFFSGLARINWAYLAEVSAEAQVAGAASLGLTEDLLWKSTAVCLPLFISVGMLRVSSCRFALTTAVLFWLAEIWNGAPDERSLAGVCLAAVPAFLAPSKWLAFDSWQQPWLAQLVERYAGHAVAFGGLVVATQPLVHWHGLLPPGISVALWLTLFAVAALVLVITGQPIGCSELFRLDQARRWSHWLPSHWLAGSLAAAGVALVLANGLAPYLGLKTFGTFSEGARLRTEGLRPNHLFMPQMYLLRHQLELAEVLDVASAEPEVTLQASQPPLAIPNDSAEPLGPAELKPGAIVPVFELERLAEDHPELTIHFRLCGQLPEVYQLGQASGWRGGRSWWQRKLLAFHPVPRDPAR
ncbi:MAG: hypothetical protein U0795_08620 [Pirellulales bacterium]